MTIKERLVRFLRRWMGERFYYAPLPDLPIDVLEFALERVRAQENAGHTEPEQKRHAAWLDLVRRYGQEHPKRVLGLALEVALWQ